MPATALCVVRTALIALSTLAAASGARRSAGEEPETIWQIGQLDDQPLELALGKDEKYSEFTRRFPGGVRFVAGQSRAEEDFPYIHPGPKDAWAGSRSHTFVIAFDLPREPSGTFLLLLDLCRSHYQFPPSLSIFAGTEKAGTVETARDGRHQSLFVRIPASAFQQGRNEIRIENATGSWAVYDGLRLERFPPGRPVEHLKALLLKDTPLFREIEGELRQVLHVEVAGYWDGEGTFHLQGGDFQREFDAGEVLLRPGLYELPIPPPPGPVTYTCSLATAGRRLEANRVTVAPHRKWTVFIAMKTHYDLGYTHPVGEMLQNAAGGMLEKVLEYCEASRSFPPEHRFRWIYPTWVLEKIRELQPAAKLPILDAAVERGDVGWNAAPFSLHTYFCGLEDLVRAFYPSVRLEKRYGRRVRWAKQTDVPGHSRFLAQVLARSGIRLLQIGANFGVRGERAPLLFWWQAPDGSRILTQLTAGYGWGYDAGRLVALERDPDYPCDVFLALYVTGDNVGPADLIEVARLAQSHGERYAYPQFRIGPVEEFADAVEARFAGQLPVVKAELTDWWIHGVASMARETSLAREARELLPAAEKLWTLAGIAGSERPYPAAAFEEGYEQSLLFSEHTWGVAGFKPAPGPRAERDLETNKSPAYEAMRESWRIKGDYARAAWRLARETSRAGLEALAEAAGAPAGSVLVFNPLNWPRSDLVRLPRAELAEGVAGLCDASGRQVPCQLDGDDIVFLARDVPPLGYTVFLPGPGPEAVPKEESGRSVLENDLYRITLEMEAGAVHSIVDRRTGEEITDPQAPYLLGQYVYEGMARIGGAGWHGSLYQGDGTGRLTAAIHRTRVEEGPVFSRFVAEGSLPIAGFPYEIGSVERVVQAVTLPRDLDWVECEVQLQGKSPTTLVEQGNVAFPFRVPEGTFCLELLGSVVDPARDLQDEGNHDAFAVQHWVDIAGPRSGVTWSPLDTTIVTLGDFRLFRWDPEYQPERTWIYAGGLNNGWSTNFQEWQGGDFRFRFRFRSHSAGGWLGGGAPRFGREVAQPLLAAALSARGRSGDAPPRETAPPPASILRADTRRSVVVNLKRAEDGRGVVLRLWNQAGEPDAARVSVPGRTLRRAVRVTATEEALPGGQGRLEVEAGAVTVPLGPFALETVRVEL